MPVTKLRNFLDEHKTKYITIQHSVAYTSQEVAAAIHVHGSELAKTTVVKLDGRFAMAVLAAPDHVDLDRLKAVAGANAAALATEKEFMDLFPGCDLGAMPPFGNLYGSTWTNGSPGTPRSPTTPERTPRPSGWISRTSSASSSPRSRASDAAARRRAAAPRRRLQVMLRTVGASLAPKHPVTASR
jgi:Ala-tRNA(Pro) deacylase